MLCREAAQARVLGDLTDKLGPAGQLPWEVPSGTWTVQVFRHRSTGDQPHPILPDEGGLECDKLSPEAVDAHWDGYIRRVLDECGPAARRVIRWVHADSYEFGPQTWTPHFRDEFTRRCGYDPLPYLPAIVGMVVDDTSMFGRFLWDFRRVRADLFAEGIGNHLRKLCRREGMALTTEPHLVPEVFDQSQYSGAVSEPVGNFLGERRTAWYAEIPPRRSGGSPGQGRRARRLHLRLERGGLGRSVHRHGPCPCLEGNAGVPQDLGRSLAHRREQPVHFPLLGAQPSAPEAAE